MPQEIAEVQQLIFDSLTDAIQWNWRLPWLRFLPQIILRRALELINQVVRDRGEDLGRHRKRGVLMQALWQREIEGCLI